MNCDCRHPRNDDGLHEEGCALLQFNAAVEAAVAAALQPILDEIEDIKRRLDRRWGVGL